MNQIWLNEMQCIYTDLAWTQIVNHAQNMLWFFLGLLLNDINMLKSYKISCDIYILNVLVASHFTLG